jgi:hypothetical protein
MEERYLILHKVRGEPALDVAERMECPICDGVGCKDCGDNGFWWITPTYGHRAYAVDSWNLKDFIQTGLTVPDDLPEHFEVSAAPKGKGLGLGANLRGHLEKLGLIKSREPLTRRSW